MFLSLPVGGVRSDTIRRYPGLTEAQFRLCATKAIKKEREINPGVTCVRRGSIWKEVEKMLSQQHELRMVECPVEKENSEPDERKGYENYNVKEKIEIKCEVCGKAYERLKMLKKHIESKHNNPKESPLLKCPKCEKLCKTVKSLKVHMKLHDRETYNCDQCEEGFVSKFKLRLHKKNAHDSQISCNKPDCAFVGTVFEVEKHNHSRHRSGNQSGNYTCEKCGKVFKSRKGAYNHKKDHKSLEALGVQLPELQQTVCPVTMPSAESLPITATPMPPKETRMASSDQAEYMVELGSMRREQEKLFIPGPEPMEVFHSPHGELVVPGLEPTEKFFGPCGEQLINPLRFISPDMWGLGETHERPVNFEEF